MKKRVVTLDELAAELDMKRVRSLLATVKRSSKNERLRETAFRDQFELLFPELNGVEVFLGRDTPVPLLDFGRMREIVRIPDADAGGRLLAALERGGWVNLHNEPIVAQDKHTAAEFWLLEQEIEVEAASARQHSPFWVAYEIACGNEVRGGMWTKELRLVNQMRLFPTAA